MRRQNQPLDRKATSEVYYSHVPKMAELEKISQKVEAKAIEPLKDSLYLEEANRVILGHQALQKLLSFNDQVVNNTLGISSLTHNDVEFDVNAHFLEATTEAHVEAKVPLHNWKGQKTKYSTNMSGFRINFDPANFDGALTESGEYCLIAGGGTRALPEEADNFVNLTASFTEETKTKQIGKAKDKAKALALAMTIKNAPQEFQEGLEEVLAEMGMSNLAEKASKRVLISGGKADVVIPLNEDIIKKTENIETNIRNGKVKNRVIFESLKKLGYELGKNGLLRSWITRLAGDMNTGFKIKIKGVWYSALDAVVLGYKDYIQDSGTIDPNPDIVASGTLNTNPLEFRDVSTVVGAIASMKAACDRKNISMKDMEVFLRGCGNATLGAASELKKHGAKITAIAAESAIIVKKKGFTDRDQKSLLKFVVEKGGTVQDWARTRKDVEISFESDLNNGVFWGTQLENAVNDFWDKEKPKAIIEAAREGTINKNTVSHIPNDAVVTEISNLTVTNEASETLKEDSRGILIIPSTLASGGGVNMSGYQYMQGYLGIKFETDVLYKSLYKTMGKMVNKTLDLVDAAKQRKENITPQEAFYALSIAATQKVRRQLLAKIAS